jgi:hypothetical protein
LLAVSLIVLVIAQQPDVDSCPPGLCGGAAMVTALQEAVVRVLGSETRIRTELAISDPADAEVANGASDVDGVVELSFSPNGDKARLHCYVAHEQRWLDREISFGASRGSMRSEINERGRLLGFAVATMYAGDTNDTEREPENIAPPTPAPAASTVPASPKPTPSRDEPAPTRPGPQASYVAEFAAVASSGLNGTASGLGASAGFRFALTGPVWARLFVAGRSGDIPEAQASTRTALMGGGLALALLPQSSRFELGARFDAFASYFDVTHLSEDDVAPDRRSRWQVGADLLAEGGFRFTPAIGALVGIGVEGIFGETAIYTHHARVAVVPPLRATAELGFRTRF